MHTTQRRPTSAANGRQPTRSSSCVRRLPTTSSASHLSLTMDRPTTFKLLEIFMASKTPKPCSGITTNNDFCELAGYLMTWNCVSSTSTGKNLTTATTWRNYTQPESVVFSLCTLTTTNSVCAALPSNSSGSFISENGQLSSDATTGLLPATSPSTVIRLVRSSQTPWTNKVSMCSKPALLYHPMPKICFALKHRPPIQSSPTSLFVALQGCHPGSGSPVTLLCPM